MSAARNVFEGAPFFEFAEGSAEGRATISFEGGTKGRSVEAVAGQRGTWTIEFTVGPGGIAEGGGIGLWGPFMEFKLDLRPQAVAPQGMGYVTASTTGRGQVELHLNPLPSDRQEIAKVLVRDAPLVEGDLISIRFNDRSEGSPGGFVPRTTILGVEIHIGVDADGSRLFVEVAHSPLVINVVADHRPGRYLVLAPSSVAPGEPSWVNIVALDSCGNLAPAASADLTVAAPDVAGLPESFSLTPLDGGRKLFQTLSLPEEGISRVKVIDNQRGIETSSNRVRCEPTPEMQLFWGDIHNHAYDSSVWLELTLNTDPDTTTATVGRSAVSTSVA